MDISRDESASQPGGVSRRTSKEKREFNGERGFIPVQETFGGHYFAIGIVSLTGMQLQSGSGGNTFFYCQPPKN